MTGIKVALYTGGLIVSSSGTLTGLIMAQMPTISKDTPVAMTLGLVTAGLIAAIVLAWKVSRAWYTMESNITRLTERIAAMERHYDSRPPISK